MVQVFLEIGVVNPLIQVGFDSLLGLSIGEAWNRQGFGKNRFDAFSLLVVFTFSPSFFSTIHLCRALPSGKGPGSEHESLGEVKGQELVA